MLFRKPSSRSKQRNSQFTMVNSNISGIVEQDINNNVLVESGTNSLESMKRSRECSLSTMKPDTNILINTSNHEVMECLVEHNSENSNGRMQFTKKTLPSNDDNTTESIYNNKFEIGPLYSIELTKMSDRESNYIKRLRTEANNPSVTIIQNYIYNTTTAIDIVGNTDECSSSITKPIVPLQCYTCWHNNNLPTLMQKNYESLKKQNPLLQFHLYDENMCLEFIEKHFDKDVLDAYNKLIPSSYKSDLWRYCILYKYGGIYLDIKYCTINNFSLEELCYKEQFVLDSSNYWENNQYGLYTAFIITKPENHILLTCIREIVQNTKDEVYGWNALYTTGPGLLGKKYFNNDLCTHINKHIDIQLFYVKNVIIYKNKPILKVYNEYRKEQFYYQHNLHYSSLWDQNAIYKKKIHPIVERSTIMRKSALPSIALIIHVGNMEILKEMLTTIKNVTSLQYKRYNLDIYFNVIDSINQKDIQFLQHNYPNATIIQSENYGFDIGSFFHILDNIKTRGLHYDYILKLHTKTEKRLRENLMNSIIGSSNTIQHCIQLFESNSNIGCIGAKNAACIDNNVDFERNANHLHLLLDRFFPDKNHTLTKEAYVSGTMFWMRFNILQSVFMNTHLGNIYNSFNNSRSFDWNWYFFANRYNFKCLPYNKEKLYEHYYYNGKNNQYSGNLFHCIEHSSKSVVLRDAMIEHAYERFFSYMLIQLDYKLCFL